MTSLNIMSMILGGRKCTTDYRKLEVLGMVFQKFAKNELRSLDF